MVGLLSVATTVVAAEVSVVDSGEVGRSAVYSRYNTDLGHCLGVRINLIP
jgi:hypothetical protein